MTTKKTFTKIITGRGTLIYPKLNAPDTKYKVDGEFQGKLKLDAEESARIITLFEKELAAYWPIAEAEFKEKVANAKTPQDKAKAKKALAEIKEADKPFRPSYNDEGDETEEFEFNFKSPATWIKDKGKATEKVMPISIDFFDAGGKQLKNVPEIWGGTIACIGAELRPFSMPIGVGVSLRLKAVQIMELRQGGSGSRDAASYGFGKEEGGYEADEAEEAPASGFKNRLAEANEEAGGSETDPEF